jgi:hypothetical protein
MKDFLPGLSAEDDAEAVIQASFGLVYLALCDVVKVDAFGEVLTDKPVDILDRPSPPRVMRVAEVNGHLYGEREGGMAGQHATVVVGSFENPPRKSPISIT